MSFEGKRLINHAIRIAFVMDQEWCGTLCFMEPNCASYNFKLSANPNGNCRCELNDVNHQQHENELEENSDYLYHGAKVRIKYDQEDD